MRIKMIRDRHFTPEDRRTGVDYKKGGEYTVKRDWGEAMVASGDAKELGVPARKTDEQA